MKKLLSLILICMTFCAGVGASDVISINLNGTPIISDTNPVEIEGRVLVPLRAIFERLEVNVNWDEDTSTVFAISKDTIITIQINSEFAFINGEKVSLDVPAKLINEKTMVPVRFVSEALDAKVVWNEATNTVEITQ